MIAKFTVQGVAFRTTTQRRYIVVAGRAAEVEAKRWDYRATDDQGRQGAYVPCRFAAYTTIVKRSDSVQTARAAASKYGTPPGGFVAVVDTTTGEAV